MHLLKKAGIRIWMISGDKIETAVGVAQASHLISNKMKPVVLTSLEHKSIVEILEYSLQTREIPYSPSILTLK